MILTLSIVILFNAVSIYLNGRDLKNVLGMSDAEANTKAIMMKTKPA